MHSLTITVVLGLLLGAQAQVILPLCDSPLAEEAALVARDHLNLQHTHGYKYELNRIEDVKVYHAVDGNETYVLEVDLLETDCHALDPTPLANCTVRSKHLTAVEGDCDVVLKKVGGVLTVTAFKCKTEESREDICLGCHTLLPLNDTDALKFLHASLATFNNNNTTKANYTVLQVGRMSSQIVSGGPQYLAEYVIVEANCTDGNCVPLHEATAEKGFCIANGRDAIHTVDCKIFSNLTPIVDANSTVPAVPPVTHAHGGQPLKHGLRHHKLTSFHNPHLNAHLSAESAESSEIVPVAPKVVDKPAPTADAAPAAPADPVPAAGDATVALDSSTSKEFPMNLRYKRDVPAAPGHPLADIPAKPHLDPVPVVPRCPGKVRFF